MSNYSESRKVHLSNYRSNNLKIVKGSWRGTDYPHILPEKNKELNILKEIRGDFWNYFSKQSIKLHQGFHHLNSSQALCFNLFFPLFHYDKRLLTYALHRIIEVTPAIDRDIKGIDKLMAIRDKQEQEIYANRLEEESIIKNEWKSVEFEKILDHTEFTNFDFYVELQKEKKVLFEVKYTENGFGSASKDKTHLNKYRSVYKKRLRGILLPEFNNEIFVLDNYQVVRNLSYVDENTTVVFLFPRENTSMKGTRELIFKILEKNARSQVRIVYLEELVCLNYQKELYILIIIFYCWEEKGERLGLKNLLTSFFLPIGLKSWNNLVHKKPYIHKDDDAR